MKVALSFVAQRLPNSWEQGLNGPDSGFHLLWKRWGHLCTPPRMASQRDWTGCSSDVGALLTHFFHHKAWRRTANDMFSWKTWCYVNHAESVFPARNQIVSLTLRIRACPGVNWKCPWGDSCSKHLLQQPCSEPLNQGSLYSPDLLACINIGVKKGLTPHYIKPLANISATCWSSSYINRSGTELYDILLGGAVICIRYNITLQRLKSLPCRAMAVVKDELLPTPHRKELVRYLENQRACTVASREWQSTCTT